MEKDYGHRPVLLRECLEALAIRPEGTYVDGTLGRAGHSLAILERLTTGRLIGIDRDETALAAAEERLAAWGRQVTLVHSNFCRVRQVLAELGIDRVDGLLFDLGVSSPQLDQAERGFSYRQDAPLDMRMDVSERLTAYEVVNAWGEEALRRILWEYGEERCAPRIARAIVARRAQRPIASTLELAEILERHGAKGSFDVVGDTSANYPDKPGKHGSASWGGVRYDHYPDFGQDANGGVVHCPELTARLLEGGHELTSHTYSHVLFGWKPLVYGQRKYLSGLEPVVEDLKRLHAYVEDTWHYTDRKSVV